jgi:aminobenzoyl-glutamate utilization protein B
MNNFEVEFFGQASHASFDPWNGRSALDAVEMMNYGVNLMREHIKPTARIHYVIPRAGEAPNVVPEYAKVWYYVRDVNREEVKKYYDRILKIAEGAALATGATYKVRLITGVHEYSFNRPLQEIMQANLELVGPPRFTAEEQAFGRALQKFLGKEEKGIHSKVEPLADQLEPLEGGSTDVAEVSWITPTAAFVVATAPEDVPWHSWATSASHGTNIGRTGAVVAAKVIAATGIDLLTRPDVLQKARAYFQKATGGRPYQSPIPKDQPPPVSAKNDR